MLSKLHAGKIVESFKFVISIVRWHAFITSDLSQMLVFVVCFFQSVLGWIKVYAGYHWFYVDLYIQPTLGFKVGSSYFFPNLTSRELEISMNFFFGKTMSLDCR